ncbi:MAG: hypothetical protein A2504_10290 [Bdellovibrionales bacterium RIFOXYD12_FULL_39_22]|nr:MAG: hypothetical protein A2385_16905 [Bdellovibrionales bacterium RIFOXYB1_FULL_39_21]OFZ44132.1 MAG: hypothetical protein A2485_14335 [Bdellovibrionales bacterium RIFOXYC12_FULL_39_17]OFZ48634.1 MAG: hypothetical protein A2404_08110 [Bdellovibrionales bacterium RIFOXYC1_FULL_39_130]OFZ70809.1 MAG: hypothetical protein A2451_06505 [Bdellovibrionales bacterium RIFOXYC2_FULL_39_8]OFZ76748.1 MAG: hypothetical protein A2560_10400 [Bdellovibrionales bacterium RIFOXYD1_FULL_39_84]OFZ95051.1 MAG:
MRLVLIVTILVLAQATNLFAYGTGLTAYPLMSEKRLVTTEFTGIVSDHGGVGIQTRYMQKINNVTSVDAGIGLAGGDRSGCAFAGIDYEIFPDYKKQPRVSIKSSFEYAKEFGLPYNNLKVAPVVSKGFSFWGHEGFPYVTMPIAISLEAEHKTYETTMNLTTGIAGKIPYEGYTHLTGNIEAVFNLKDSYSAIFMGVSYPLN